MARHNVVIAKDDGGVEMYPMKEWLRQHPQHIPPGLDPMASTSHQLRNGLRRLGWSMQETPDEVRLLMPTNQGISPVVDEVLGIHGEGESEVPEAYFGLEHQLRDFLAQNIGTIEINSKRLRLYVDPTGRDGIEFPTAVGPIDILAVDDSNAFFASTLRDVGKVPNSRWFRPPSRWSQVGTRPIGAGGGGGVSDQEDPGIHFGAAIGQGTALWQEQ